MSETNMILADRPGLGKVRLCECNSVHLNIGPISINLEPEAFIQTATMLRDAVEQLTTLMTKDKAIDGLFDPVNRNFSRLTN